MRLQTVCTAEFGTQFFPSNVSGQEPATGKTSHNRVLVRPHRRLVPVIDWWLRICWSRVFQFNNHELFEDSWFFLHVDPARPRSRPSVRMLRTRMPFLCPTIMFALFVCPFRGGSALPVEDLPDPGNPADDPVIGLLGQLDQASMSSVGACARCANRQILYALPAIAVPHACVRV